MMLVRLTGAMVRAMGRTARKRRLRAAERRSVPSKALLRGFPGSGVGVIALLRPWRKEGDKKKQKGTRSKVILTDGGGKDKHGTQHDDNHPLLCFRRILDRALRMHTRRQAGHGLHAA
jgi:hypothetical protein